MNQMNTTDTTTTACYEFQPPSNMVAIRSNIINRIKQQKTSRRLVGRHSSTSPSHHNNNNNNNNEDCTLDNNEKHSFSALDNGLPSPPIETCLYEEEEKPEGKLPTEMVVNALMELTQEMPPSPVMSKASSNAGDSVSSSDPSEVECSPLLESSDVYREKIRLLKEEKHKLFQVMKDLLSKPVVVQQTPKPITMATQQQPSNNNSHVTMTTTTPTPTREKRRSSSRDNGLLKSRPTIARSRSISHIDSTLNRPISRYYNNNNSSSRYSYYPYNRTSYPTSSSLNQPLLPCSSSSSSSSLNMVSF